MACWSLTLVACAQGGDDVAEGGDTRFREQIAGAISEAAQGGASQAQRDLLERSRRAGEVSVEISRQARRAFSECAAQAGIRVSFDEKRRPDGWVATVTTVEGGGRADTEQVATQCERAESLWVTMLYDTQPTAEQATREYLEQQAPALRACLKAAGFSPDPEATGMELAMSTTQAGEQPMREAGARCLVEIGLDGF